MVIKKGSAGMKKKYLFFDIDGTLTTGGMNSFIPETAKQTLRALRKNGHVVAIATGRPYAMSKDVAKDLGVDSFICNGGNTVIFEGEKIVNESLNQDNVRALLQECIEYDFPYCISQKDDFYFLTQDMSKLPDFGNDFLKDFLKEEHFDPAKLSHVKRFMVFVDREQQKKLTTYPDLVPQRYEEAFVMIEPDDKYKGIKKLMEKQGFPLEDVVVFGDGENDIKMFQQAACSIAVGNAIPELKELASYITERSDEDGIMKACLHFGWIKEEDMTS